MGGPLIFTPEYYERMRLLEEHAWWNAGMRDVASALLADVALPRVGTMLDVGCGSGQTMHWFRREHPEWRLFGLDVAEDGLRAARDFHEDVAGASALQLPFANASIDVVVTLDVVQHLPLGGGDGQALSEMRRVLRPGGALLLRTNAQSFPRIRDDHAYNFHKYDPRELVEKLVAAGFSIARLSRVNAVLGLAEIPRELRAAREHAEVEYRGILAKPSPGPRRGDRIKRRWLAFEGRLVRSGVRLPIGRTLIAVCRAGTPI
jgi:SAM-dependent methyltransferase